MNHHSAVVPSFSGPFISKNYHPISLPPRSTRTLLIPSAVPRAVQSSFSSITAKDSQSPHRTASTHQPRIFKEDPSVKLASLRRNRTMPTDGAIAKFLYTILKQLDLKSIDWNNVAGQLDITNGHAARMRFSRFKQQMEGVPPAPRKPRSAVPRNKKPKPQKTPKHEPRSSDDAPAAVKAEPEPMYGIEPTIKPEPVIKEEPDLGQLMPVLEPESSANANILHQMTLDPSPYFQHQAFSSITGTEYPSPPSPIIKAEPGVKMEPFWDN